MTKVRIIGLAGKMQSGKTTIADFLCENHGYKKLSIANGLKQLCADMLGVDSIEELNKIKEVPFDIPVIPDDRWINAVAAALNLPKEQLEKDFENVRLHNVREVLQVIGTDIIRKYNPLWHIQQVINKIKSSDDNMRFVIDDVRFPDEKLLLEELGATAYYVVRPMEDNESLHHPSEASLTEDDFNSNQLIYNNGTIVELYQKIKMI